MLRKSRIEAQTALNSFRQMALQKLMIFCSSILALLLTHNFYIKNFINKKLLW